MKETALHWACKRGDKVLARALREAGATNKAVDDSGLRPSDWARADDEEMMDILGLMPEIEARRRQKEEEERAFQAMLHETDVAQGEGGGEDEPEGRDSGRPREAGQVVEGGSGNTVGAGGDRASGLEERSNAASRFKVESKRLKEQRPGVPMCLEGVGGGSVCRLRMQECCRNSLAVPAKFVFDTSRPTLPPPPPPPPPSDGLTSQPRHFVDLFFPHP